MIDLGFQLTQIGAVAKLTLFWGSIAGGIVGGVWMMRLGINRALWIFGVVQASTSLLLPCSRMLGRMFGC